MIYVKDLLKLDTFKDFELVSGENGLDRGVSWPNVAQTVSIREWLVGGDVILMSGVGLKITDEFLTDIVIQAADGRAACIIMLINPKHIASIPQAAIDEAVKRGLAVFAAPWETKLSRVIGSVSMLVSNDRLEERMHSEFLDRLLSGEINHDDSAYRQSMEKYGLLGKKAVAVIDYKFDEKYLQTENQAYHNDRVMRKMISLFERYFGKINYLNQYNRQAFIISADNTEEKDIVNAIRTIYNIFIKENKHVHVRIGIGEIAQGLEGLKKSYDQSRIARKTINKSGVMFYKELGIYQLLFYIDDTSKIDDYVKENKKMDDKTMYRYILDNLAYRLKELSISSTNKKDYLKQYADMAFKDKKQLLGNRFSEYCRLCTLKALDDGWIEEVDYLQQLQAAISGRSTAQRNLLYEYQREARLSFRDMEKSIKKAMIRNILLGEVSFGKDNEMIILYP